MKDRIAKAAEAIKRHKRFLITAHVNLEGDSIGSQLAMKELIEGLGKSAFILDNDKIPPHYEFLPGADGISNKIGARSSFDAAVVLDCPTLKRVGKIEEVIAKGKFIINIDHHVSNDGFGTVNWVDAKASSTGEMIYRLFKEMSVPLTKETALCLYIAILTDTGSFNYDNTSSATHEIASELLGYGLEPAIVSENVYDRRSAADIKLLEMVLGTLKLNKAGDIAYLEITKEMLDKTGVDVSRSEGFINYARSIDTAKIAVLFREDHKRKGMINVSFRSKGHADVNSIASFFGGGGHMRAAGCVVKGTLPEVERKVLARVEEVLRGRDTGRR